VSRRARPDRPRRRGARRAWSRERRGLGRGVDGELFDPNRRNEVLRAELLGDADTLLLSVGRVSHEKRLDHLLQAFARVSRPLPGVRMLVVGDGPARRELERTAPAGVAFYGETRGDELAQLYAAADVFCFASTTDTFGQVLLEAAASGLPVVAVAAGGAVDLVEDGITGRLVAQDDVAAFACALSELVEAPAARARCAAAGRRRALERTWDAALAELASCYRRVCSTEDLRTPLAA
jgi:phosphatidylinositol alpha 1,6-mannosyltransferase